MTATNEFIGWVLTAIGSGFVAAFGWAWRINDRLTTLETKHAGTDATVIRIDEKLDRLIDKLL